MAAKKKKEITNTDLMDFMGGMAENITGMRKEVANIRTEMRTGFADVRKEMATKSDLRELRKKLLDEVKEVKAELKALSKRTDEDDRATVRTIKDVQKECDILRQN